MTRIDPSTFLPHVTRWAWIAALAVGCTSETTMYPPPGPPPDAGVTAVDPTGNWDLTYMFNAGCGQPATTAMATFTVTRTPSGYAVAIAGAITSGTLICTPESCKLSGTFAWSDANWQYQQNANMTLDAQGGITGNGTESIVGMTGTCNVAFKVQGTKS